MTILRRAAFCAALFLSASLCLAQNKAPRSETYKDIIEKAHNLSLQKDRQQALSILVAAIKRETKPAAITELKRTVQEISGLFFSDKAQQLYEVGVSLRRTDLPQAQIKVAEAARIEPDNSTIVNELSRLLIAKGDCSGALDNVGKQMKISPYDEELKLTWAQAMICQGNFKEVTKTFESKEVTRSGHQKFWLSLDIDKSLREKNLTKAQESLSALQKLDPRYPEISYWTWKIDALNKKINLEAAQKYVMSCKNISASQYRQYMIDPMLCRRMTEIDSELKGLNGTTE